MKEKNCNSSKGVKTRKIYKWRVHMVTMEDKLDVPQEVIDDIVQVLTVERPLGHARVPFMLNPYIRSGFASNYGVDNVVWAVEKDVDLSSVDFTPIGYGDGQTNKSPQKLNRERLFCLVSQEEGRIFPAYAEAIGYST